MDAEQLKNLILHWSDELLIGRRGGEQKNIFAAIDAMQAEIGRLRSALNLMVIRMQMNIDDGSRLDKTTMEMLVQRAQAALSKEAEGERA